MQKANREVTVGCHVPLVFSPFVLGVKACEHHIFGVKMGIKLDLGYT